MPAASRMRSPELVERVVGSRLAIRPIVPMTPRKSGGRETRAKKAASDASPVTRYLKQIDVVPAIRRQHVRQKPGPGSATLASDIRPA